MSTPEEKQPKPKTLAPWVHPKAKNWFADLFEQSGLVMQLQDAVDNPEQPVSPEEARILMMVIATLGHDGIWPSERRKDLQKLVMKLGRLVKQGVSESQSAISMGEHKRRQVVAEEVKRELEFLRRMVGVSNRVSDLHLPKSWGQFWT
jgi:hypothetical protein